MSVLADFPVAALRLSEETTFALKQLGFDRIGQDTEVPRPLLAQRLGVELQLRLDQASSDVFEPISPTFSDRDDWGATVICRASSDGRRLPLRGNSAGEKGHIEVRSKPDAGARKLGLCFERVDGGFQFVPIGPAKPSRSSPHLTRLLRDRIDRIHPGLGVEAVRLTVFLDEPLAYSQAGSSLIGPQESYDLPPIVDCLANRLGVERIYRVIPAASSIPERTVSISDPLAVTQVSWPPSLPRPTRLLAPPQRNFDRLSQYLNAVNGSD